MIETETPLSNPRTSVEDIEHRRRRERIASLFDIISPRGGEANPLPSPVILGLSFLVVTFIGTLILLLPFSQHDGGFTPFLDALFAATSATTATGLTTQDVPTFWTRPGQFVLLALMFTGGLGFMFMASALLLNVGMRTQSVLTGEVGSTTYSRNIVRLGVRITLVVIGVQLAGFLAYLVRFSFVDSTTEALWKALSFSVSAFNNAGFVNIPRVENVGTLHPDWASLAITGILIALGALGWMVVLEVGQKRRWVTLSLNTKIVLSTTALLTLIGAGLVFLSEFENPATIGGLPLLDKMSISMFESISGRTAGFNTISYAHTEQHTNFFMTGLMLVGGASASVAGGIKVNTLAVLIVAIVAVMAGRTNASIFRREIPLPQIQRAMTLCISMIAVAFVAVILLTFSERGQGFAFIDLMFEAVSAISTSGLSTGLTSELSGWGKLVVTFAMFVGRVFPLSLALVMIGNARRETAMYATERVTIG